MFKISDGQNKKLIKTPDTDMINNIITQSHSIRLINMISVELLCAMRGLRNGSLPITILVLAARVY
jgi:hypothetical protein